MKVLQINAVYGISSTGRITMELEHILQQQGHQSLVAATKTNCQRDGLYIIGNKWDWKLHALCSRIFGLQGYYSGRATKKLIQYIEAEKPDIIHLHNLHANYVNLPMLFRYIAEKNIATVITLHDCWFYTGKCTHYTTEQCFKWKTGCQNCPKLRTDNKSWLFDRTAKMWADRKAWFEWVPRLAVVGVSDWIAEDARKSVMRSAKYITRIYNWIDLECFKPQTECCIQGYEGKFVILGVASGWGEKKGLPTFLELSRQLEDDEVLILVGGMPAIHLPDNIVHIPATENVQKLVDYYCLADVFLQLSKEESFGKVAAEALACGTPVITVDSTANKELVPDGCGIVLDHLDVPAVKNALQTVRKNGKKYYSDSCRCFAEDNFAMKDRVNDYIHLYEKLLEI